MQQPNIPDGYQQVMPYIIVKGAAGFMKFMEEVFGAAERMKHMRDEHIIAHAEINIGACVIMFADATDASTQRTGGFFIYVADADTTYSKAIAAGSAHLSPMANMPYGRSGGVTDPFGNQWWITTPPAQPNENEH